MRPATFAIALLLFLLPSVGGCITLNERSIDHDFDGLAAAMSRSSTVGMLLVHGMGGYSPGDPKALIAGVQAGLHLRAIGPPTTEPAAQPAAGEEGANAETLTRQDFVSPAGHALRVYTLDWEPLTAGLKRQYLAYDATEDVARLRLPLHNTLKQSLMNENVPDVVLYVGSYQRVMQRAVRYALRRMRADAASGGAAVDDYEYFFVTFSLGSKIVFDVVDQMDGDDAAGGGDAPAGERAPDRIVDRTASFFMLANQLPLLGLGSASPAATRPAGPGEAPGYDSMLRFVRRKRRRGSAAATGRSDRGAGERANGAAPPAPATQPAGGGLAIVAVSDPNDLFSYTIPPYVKQQFPATFVNVQISVAKTGYWIPYEGYVANPMEAHTGYGHDPDVIRLILNGGRATAAPR